MATTESTEKLETSTTELSFITGAPFYSTTVVSVMSNSPPLSVTEVGGSASASDQLPVAVSGGLALATWREGSTQSSSPVPSDSINTSDTPPVTTVSGVASADDGSPTSVIVVTPVTSGSSTTAVVTTSSTSDLVTTSSTSDLVATSSTTDSNTTSTLVLDSVKTGVIVTSSTTDSVTTSTSVLDSVTTGVIVTSSTTDSVTTSTSVLHSVTTGVATLSTQDDIIIGVATTSSTPDAVTYSTAVAASTSETFATDVATTVATAVSSTTTTTTTTTISATPSTSKQTPLITDSGADLTDISPSRSSSSGWEGVSTSYAATATAGWPPTNNVTGSGDGVTGVGASSTDAVPRITPPDDSETVTATTAEANLPSTTELAASGTFGDAATEAATLVTPSDLFPAASTSSDSLATPLLPDMSTSTMWDSANDSASHVFTTSTFSITTTSVTDTTTTTTDITAAAAAAADTVTAKDVVGGDNDTLSSPAHVTGYSEVQTTVTSGVPSSTDTSGAATPDLPVDHSKPGTTERDGSGDMESSGSVITDKPTTPLDRWTSFMSSSSSVAGKPTIMSVDNSTSNGTVATSHGFGGSDSLIIVLSTCLTLFFFIVVAIALALYCYRRKQRKQAEHHSNEDLWVKPPTDSLAPLSVSSTEPSVPDQLPEKSVPVQERPLYKVVHEFPAPQDTQLPLAVGELVAVDEKAENGWWRGYVLGKSELNGWFPSSFVEEIKDKNTSTNQSSLATMDMEVESGPSRHASISSFLIRKKHDDNLLRENSFSLGTLSAQNKAAALQSKSNPILQTSPGHAVVIGTTADDLTNAVQGKHFKVLFAYKAAFRGELNLREGEIIIGKERDRNGWMLGTKLKAKEEGWFPAVYVDQVVGELPKEEMPDAHTEKMELDQEVYGQLAVNRNKSPDQAWLGIEHVANYAYKGTSETELKFKKGDIVIVFEAQDSGWWLGCHGDNVGWFPGAYVELLEQKSDSDGIALELLSPQLRNKDGSSKDTQSQRSSTASNSSDTPKDLADVKSSVSVSSESIIGDKPKPARKAPQPPGADKSSGNGATVVVSGTGTLSRNLRPVRPAPAPPIQKIRPESVSSMDKLGVRMNQDTDESSSTKLKPLKKTRKPIIVRIPKEKVGLDKISSCAVPKKPVPSVHEEEEQHKNKDDCAKQDKDDRTKRDSDHSGDSEIEKECSLLAECMTKLVSNDLDIHCFASQVNDTEAANKTDILDHASSTKDDPTETAVKGEKSLPLSNDTALNFLNDKDHSSPFILNQDKGEKQNISHADSVLPSYTSEANVKEEEILDQHGMSDASESKSNSPSDQESLKESRQDDGFLKSDSTANASKNISSVAPSNGELEKTRRKVSSSEDNYPNELYSDHSGDCNQKLSATSLDNHAPSELPSSQRYSGHWKFHRDKDQGQKHLRLTKVSPPVVPMPVIKMDNTDGDEMMTIPPPGVSGHVSMIVHQINQRISKDLRNPDHKLLRQHSTSSGAQASDNMQLHVQETSSAHETSGSSKSDNLPSYHQTNSEALGEIAQATVVNGFHVNDSVSSSSLAGSDHTVQSQASKDVTAFDSTNHDGDINETEPVMRTKRPPPPKSPPPSLSNKLSRLRTPRLWRTLMDYSAQRDDELSFDAGVFIRELNESAERPGWIYGMLADGFSGFFPVVCAEISSSDIETEL